MAIVCFFIYVSVFVYLILYFSGAKVLRYSYFDNRLFMVFNIPNKGYKKSSTVATFFDCLIFF